MQLAHFCSKLVLNNGDFTLWSRPYFPHVVQIEFDSEFSNDSSPAQTTITIHGITRRTANQFYSGAQLALYAGFYNVDYTANNLGLIMQGKIIAIEPLQNNAGDWTLVITVQDGSSYDTIGTLKTKVSKDVRKKASLKSNPKLARQHRQAIDEITARYKRIRDSGKHTRKQGDALTADENKEKAKVNTTYKAKINASAKAEAKTDSTKKKVEYQPISFKPGVKGETIIKTLASKAGIKIARLELKKNKIYKKGYKASKKPYQCIQEVANDCGTDVMYVHGGLSIAPFAKQKKLMYVATVETGLISPPQLQVDDSVDSTNATTNNSKTKKKANKNKVNKIVPSVQMANELANGVYQATIALNPDISTGSIFRIEDKGTNFSDWVVTTSGEHSASSGSTPTTQVTLELYSKYEKDEAAAKHHEMTAEEKKEKSKDKAVRSKAHSMRHARTLVKTGGGSHRK